MTLFELRFSQCICPVVGLLGRMVVLFLVFYGTFILFSIVAVSVYIPTNSSRRFPFLHTLSSIYCLYIFWWWPFWPASLSLDNCIAMVWERIRAFSTWPRISKVADFPLTYIHASATKDFNLERNTGVLAFSLKSSHFPLSQTSLNCLPASLASVS